MDLGVVIAGDPWLFFGEIFDDFKARYRVSVFERRRLNSPIFYYRINRHLFRRDLKTFLAKQDVVFFEWASDLLAAASRLPKCTRLVTRLHRYEMFEWSKKINWENVDRIILVSHAMQRKFAERFPEHAHKTVVIYEGVDTQKFRPLNKPFGGDIGTLCFMTPRKRVYELILTFAELVEQRPGLRLHIGGTSNKFGDYNDAVYSLPAKLGIQDQVIFYGDVTEPWKWYPNIDIFISNSYSEGLQVAPIEAMASARYVLSHRWDGAEELLPPGQLYLTDSQLKARILEYVSLTEAEQRNRQAAMRARACELFDMGQIKAQIRAVIEEVAQEKTGVADGVQG